jgi:hypothetical protein
MIRRKVDRTQSVKGQTSAAFSAWGETQTAEAVSACEGTVKGLESRLQAAECARFWAAEEVPGHPTVGKLSPAKAGTPNPAAIDPAVQIRNGFSCRPARNT